MFIFKLLYLHTGAFAERQYFGGSMCIHGYNSRKVKDQNFITSSNKGHILMYVWRLVCLCRAAFRRGGGLGGRPSWIPEI